MLVAWGAFSGQRTLLPLFAYGSLQCNGRIVVLGRPAGGLPGLARVLQLKASPRCASRAHHPDRILKQRKKAGKSCYIKKKKKKISQIRLHLWILLLHGRTEESDLPTSAANITWHSLTVGDLIFDHKGSRRASASERILAELGTFQGPGPRRALMLCRASGMLFREETFLLPASLE